MSRFLPSTLVRRAPATAAVVAGVLAASLLPGIGQGQPGAAPALLTAELLPPLVESVQEEVSVSGAVVVGVGAAGALSGAAALAGLVVPASAERLCLTLVSRDGVYFSRGDYRVPEAPAPGQRVRLPFASQQRALLRDYAPGDLAVLATPGACDEPGSTYLVAAAGEPDATVDVLINAFGANDVYYRLGRDGAGSDGAGPDSVGIEGDCEVFSEGRRTSYDFRCAIPVAALTPGSQSVVIERERYGRSLGSVAVELVYGGP